MYNDNMKTKVDTSPPALSLGELSLSEAIAEWKRQRRLNFLNLIEMDGLSKSAIARKYNITRQAVGQLLADK